MKKLIILSAMFLATASVPAMAAKAWAWPFSHSAHYSAQHQLVMKWCGPYRERCEPESKYHENEPRGFEHQDVEAPGALPDKAIPKERDHDKDKDHGKGHDHDHDKDHGDKGKHEHDKGDKDKGGHEKGRDGGGHDHDRDGGGHGGGHDHDGGGGHDHGDRGGGHEGHEGHEGGGHDHGDKGGGGHGRD